MITLQSIWVGKVENALNNCISKHNHLLTKYQNQKFVPSMTMVYKMLVNILMWVIYNSAIMFNHSWGSQKYKLNTFKWRMIFNIRGGPEAHNWCIFILNTLIFSNRSTLQYLNQRYRGVRVFFYECFQYYHNTVWNAQKDMTQKPAQHFFGPASAWRKRSTLGLEVHVLLADTLPKVFFVELFLVWNKHC